MKNARKITKTVVGFSASIGGGYLTGTILGPFIPMKGTRPILRPCALIGTIAIGGGVGDFARRSAEKAVDDLFDLAETLSLSPSTKNN